MIGIVDYGLGNVQAFQKIYNDLGVAVSLVCSAEELIKCDRLILPGVGAFDWAMEQLTASGMLQALTQRVLKDRVPILGVCVGMQIMADSSEEGKAVGLGWVPGKVRQFQDESFTQTTHLPHMGWNDVSAKLDDPLFHGAKDPQYYFLHSYYFDPRDDSHAIALTNYGIQFASAIRDGNIWATQFHPEKSHHWGVKLLDNFSRV